MQKEVLRYGLKNDYMFRAALQSNEAVLRGLLCALLGMEMEEVKECMIENPIVLGESIDDKTCVLDIKILLNNSKRLNIELQTSDYKDWQDRSLLYLCRAFDDLEKGAKYSDLKTTIHIGILDFTLFPDAPEFYSENLMMNVKNQKIFNSKFVLRVLDLTQLKNVSEQDKETDLYYWAKLFQATSWEEILMLAEKSEALKEAAVTMRKLNADERIRMQCEAREQIEHDMASSYQHGLEVGKREGKREGEARVNQLIQILIQKSRSEEIERMVNDGEYQEQLFKEFGL